MEFNNAVRENTDHSLRHGSKKANMEKNQNPRIIPCKFLFYFFNFVHFHFSSYMIHIINMNDQKFTENHHIYRQKV